MFPQLYTAMWIVAGLAILTAANEYESLNEIRLKYTGNIPSEEYNALFEFYTALNGQNWHWEAINNNQHYIPWNFSAHANPCLDYWQGLVCDYSTEPLLHISEIVLSTYNLVGSIPPIIDTFTKLNTLQLANNRISGQIPSEIGNLVHLADLRLSKNKLTGPIPSSLGQLANLTLLFLPANHLSGPLPSALQQLTSLLHISIGFNAFSGTIPTWIEQWSNLTTADMYANDFSGPIPESICTLPRLTFVELQFNRLTGSIPACLSVMPVIQFIGLYNNYLTGPLPDAAGVKAPRLQYIEVQNNFLSGTIPASYGSFTRMLWLSLQNNSLSGTIPSELGSLAQLQFLSLRKNKITGSIPTTLNQLSKLTELLLEHNQLTGGIHNIINASTQLRLQTIQLNDNILTGTLPEDVFTLPKLHTFAAVSNCFTGPLPTSVCNCTGIHSLTLDGLTSAESCHRDLIPHISSSYILKRSFSGSIPECLYTLPNITTLHLSGNGFTGTLPNAAFSPSLLDLSVSHNRLVGTIPLHIQSTEWYSLDLSYNLLDGTLNEDWPSSAVFNKSIIYDHFVTELTLMRMELLHTNDITFDTTNVTDRVLYTQLYLSNNRLSGRIPHALKNRHDISILGSNVFSCHLDSSDLPSQDSGIDRYQCGSDNFNTQYYIWLGLALLGGCLLCVVLYSHRVSHLSAYLTHFTAEKAQLYLKFYRIHTYMQLKYAENNPLSQFSQVITLYEFMLRLTLYCTVFIVCILLPLYAIISAYFGTLTHQYAWTVSVAYLSGVVPMALMLLFLLLLVLLVVYVCMGKVKLTSVDVNNGGADDQTKSKEVSSATIDVNNAYDVYCVYAQNGLVYSVFILVNIAIVVGVNVAYVYVAIYRSRSLLVLSQVLLSLFKLVWNNVLSALLLRYASSYLAKGSAGNDATVALETRFTTLLIFVALFNNVAIPCLVVAVVSPNCFYNVFVPPPTVQSTYAYEICAIMDRISGACTLILPVLSETSYRPPFSYNYKCSSSLVTYYAPAYITMCIVSGFLTPLFQYGLYQLYLWSTPGTTLYNLLHTRMTRLVKPLREDDDAGSILTDYDPVRPFFKAGRVLIILFTYLALLLTFGAVFPPLAAALCVTVVIVTSVVRLRIGRFLDAAERLELTELIHRVEKECLGVGRVSVLQNAMWMLITVSCLFYTLFLFDTLGDAVGFDRAYWVLIVVPLLPLCIYISLYVCARVSQPAKEVDSAAPTVRASDVVNSLHRGSGEVELSADSNSVSKNDAHDRL